MPLTALEIKVRILQKGDTIAGLARRWGVWENDVSRVIHRTPGRALPKVRTKLARYLGVPVAEIGRESARQKAKQEQAA